jgi:hypothetical protein
MNNFLHYGTCPDQYQVHYCNLQAPFESGKEILTQLPKNVAMIRAVATLAFASIVALKLSGTVFCWPVAIAGIAFAGWTVYSHLLSKDPLMETFYKITGGRDGYETLPQINIAQNPNEKICEAIRRINWDDLNHSIARTRTLDGRNVIIIKGLSRNNDEGFLVGNQTKSVLAFVEKTAPEDVPRVISNSPEIVDAMMHAISLEGNTFGRWLYSHSSTIGVNEYNSYCKVHSSITSDMANELFAQLAIAR